MALRPDRSRRTAPLTWPRGLAGVVVAVLLSTGAAAARAQVPAAETPPVPQVVLVQNSGWMEPFYTDPGSQFRPLLAAFLRALASTSPESRIIVASFNQDGQLPGRRSPHVLYAGRGVAQELDAAIASLTLPRRPDGKFTDADFGGALLGTIDRLLERQPGIIWMVTNNKNAPDNAGEVNENTALFYRTLRTSDSIPRMVAWPVRLPVRGQFFSESGLILYGIAYGPSAGPQLAAISRSEPLAEIFTDPPAQLKPLADDPLLFRPAGIEGPASNPRLEGGVLLLDGMPAAGGTVRITGRLISSYYPHAISSARLGIAFSPLPEAPLPVDPVVDLAPREVRGLGPRGSLSDVTVTLQIPQVPRPPGIAGLFEDRAVFAGFLVIAMADMRLQLAPAFREKVDALFGLSQLPEIFFDHRGVSQASTVVPVRIEVQYGAGPLIAALAAAGGTGVALLAALALLTRSRKFQVDLDGQPVVVSVRPFRTRVVRTADGQAALRVRGSLFGSAGVRDLRERPS